MAFQTCYSSSMWHAFANILYSCRNQVQPGLSTCVPQHDLMIIYMYFYVKCGSIKLTFTCVFTGTKTYITVPLLTFMPLLIQAIDWWPAIILVCMENVSHSIECDSELNSRALENCLSVCLNEIHYSRVN